VRCFKQHACDSEQPVYDASWHEKSDLSIRSRCAAIESAVMFALVVTRSESVTRFNPGISTGFKQVDDLLTSKPRCDAANVDCAYVGTDDQVIVV
jgi:hypothetical protein